MVERYENDPQLIRRFIAKANRKIARLQPAIISEDCLVYSLNQNGQGYTETFGESRSTPKKIMGGQDLESLIKPFLKRYLDRTDGACALQLHLDLELILIDRLNAQ